MAHPYNSDTEELTNARSVHVQGSISVNGGSVNIRAADVRETTLEKCRNQAMSNMYVINDLGSRVAALLVRLRGPQILKGSAGEDDDSEPRGMLVVHLEQLEYEAQRLGEIQSDLAELDRLL